MIDRPISETYLAPAFGQSGDYSTQAKTVEAVFCASIGPELTLYHIDVEKIALDKQSSILLPANIQYAWRHPRAPILYVATSNGGPGIAGDGHYVSALRFGSKTATMQLHGPTQVLRSRPIHIGTDREGKYVLIAYNDPADVTVHRISQDGSIGDEVKQQNAIDVGIFPHQILTIPSNSAAILVTRGNDAVGLRPENPGALKIFSFRDGHLQNKSTIAPDGGYGFGPRHIDFHPTQPWIYVSLERQNKIQVYKLDNDTLDPQPLFTKDILSDPMHVRPKQFAGTVHIHPNGHHAYVANRGDAMTDFQGEQVDGRGENNIAVFAIDPMTGEPVLIQNVDTHGFHPRTFSVDPSGNMLVVANLTPRLVRDGDRTRMQPATLSAFRIGADGKLLFVRSYHVDTAANTQFWSGVFETS